MFGFLGRIIWLISAVLVGLLLVRFFFLLFGVASNGGLVTKIYDWSSVLVTPFAKLLGQDAAVSSGGSTFSFTTLLALVVYVVIAAIVVRLFVGPAKG